MIPENKVVQTSGSDHPTHRWHTQAEKHRSVGFRMITAVSKAVSFVFHLLHVCKWLLRMFPRPGHRERQRERETDGKTDRQTDRNRERHRERQTDRQRERERERD